MTIYGYALLPGTEFYDRRHEYQIETERIEPSADVAADYVVGTFSCPRAEMLEGYALVAAHAILNTGKVIPLTSRYLALRKAFPVAPMLKVVLGAWLETDGAATGHSTESDGLGLFAARLDLWRSLVSRRKMAFKVIRRTVAAYVGAHTGSAEWGVRVSQLLDLDEARCSEPDTWTIRQVRFQFRARRVLEALARMELPDDELFVSGAEMVDRTFLDALAARSSHGNGGGRAADEARGGRS